MEGGEGGREKEGERIGGRNGGREKASKFTQYTTYTCT
jgi:hypothetical protein